MRHPCLRVLFCLFTIPHAIYIPTPVPTSTSSGLPQSTVRHTNSPQREENKENHKENCSEKSMEDNSPSLKHKIKQSLCLSCCFPRRKGRHMPFESPQSPSDDNPAVIWIKNKGTNEHSLTEIKDKCRSILGCSGWKHKRHASADFRYDPLSYALNFEDGFYSDDEATMRNFSARLPPSPPVAAAAN